MKITIDGGGLCVPTYKRYGNYVFTVNLTQAVSKYDTENSYYVYSFCNRPSSLYLHSNSFYRILTPKFLWMKLRVSVEESIVPKDIFLALNQALPLFTRSRIMGFSHGLSFMYYPGYYKDSYQRMRKQVESLVNRAEHIFVSSQRVKDEMTELFPRSQSKLTVALYGMPFDMMEHKERVRQNYFVFSGMNHPIKNIKFLVDAFLKFSSKKEYKGYRLFLIGTFAGYKKRSKQIQTFAQLSRPEILEILRKARGYVTTSLYESFNIPVLEALSQGCEVVGMDTAIIPELKPYVFNAYSEDEFIDMLERVASGERKKKVKPALQDVFSWKEYVSKLQAVYNK
ncbi:MAG: hypothetical protein RI947_868 [Candidatus Parcubacteria bacterium]